MKKERRTHQRLSEQVFFLKLERSNADPLQGLNRRVGQRRMVTRAKLKKVRRRVQLFKNTQKKSLLPPGTPIHIGDIPDFKPYVSVHTYCAETLNETLKIEAPKIDAVLRSLSPDQKTNWVDVEGIHDVALVKQISQIFDVHPLTQEDLVNTNQRPSFVSFPGYYFFSIKMLYLAGDPRTLQQEHVSIILKGNTVLSFQERPGDVFQVIRDRITKSVGRVRMRGADYLAYMLLDAIVDGYYQIVDHIGDKIEALEEELRLGARNDHIERIHELRREILFLRKNVLPVRDMMSKIQVEGSVFAENSRIYLTDLNDHIQQVADGISIYTELSSVLLETYHSQMNYKMNQIFKVLTMFSTIFLPLNFIAGVYGMNFKHMPELEHANGYPMVLGLMLVVAALMVTWFIWSGWLFDKRRRAVASSLSTTMNGSNGSSGHLSSAQNSSTQSTSNGSSINR